MTLFRFAIASAGLALACGSSVRHDDTRGSSGSTARGNESGEGGESSSTGGSAQAGTGASAASGGPDARAGASSLAGTSNANGGTGGPGDIGRAGSKGDGLDFPNLGGMETCGPGGCISDTVDPPVVPPGPVLCGGATCGEGEACCLATSECFDPEDDPGACPIPELPEDTWGRTPCASNAHCGERQFCLLEGRLCQGTGYCNPIGNCGRCGGECEVCGCDGNSYPDIQTACLASTNVVSVQGGGCGEVVEVGGERGEPVRQRRPCGKNEDCGDAELCCAVTGVCYDESEPELCRVPPEDSSFPCLTDEQCLPYEYCAGDGCAGPGGCRAPSDEDCGVTLEPVCGCDGTTYTSEACAVSRGVRVAAQGECAED